MCSMNIVIGHAAVGELVVVAVEEIWPPACVGQNFDDGGLVGDDFDRGVGMVEQKLHGHHCA
jgi:hypothetical protein